MDLLAKIKGIKYKPFLCRNLSVFDFNNLEKGINSFVSFILKVNEEDKIAISWWVSAKRTRSYPYARVYDTLGFSGKKVTIIPIVKDEGAEGDRDFLQWDTVSLMSLLGIYVIIAYYSEAEANKRYKNKITNQRFDIDFLKDQIKSLLSYQSDALHWNLSQIDNAGQIGKKALEAYNRISKKLGIEMHFRKSAEERINELLKGKEKFMNLSRSLAEKAQRRESLTVQPKENLSGTKAIITIQNYLGGLYYFTVDEIEINGDEIFLIEGKHSKTKGLPSLEDIKDGLLKMILFTNLSSLETDGKDYKPLAALKLTVEGGFEESNLSLSQKEVLNLLRKEAEVNNFRLILK